MSKKNQIESIASGATIEDPNGLPLAQYNADTIQIINNVNGKYDDRFIVFFSNALKDISSNRNLGKVDLQLLMRILYNLSINDIRNNTISYDNQSYWAVQINQKQPNIARSFKRLQEFGYIAIDKKLNQIRILINPNIATNTSTRRVKEVKQLDMFNEYFKTKKKKTIEAMNKEEQQDWDSHAERELNKKIEEEKPYEVKWKKRFEK